MTQLGLFADAPAEPHALAMAPLSPGNDWWLSGDVAERRAGILRSADFWQRTHEASGLEYSQEAIYAANLLRVAADMDQRPEFYQAKPAGISDFQWWLKGGQE